MSAVPIIHGPDHTFWASSWSMCQNTKAWGVVKLLHFEKKMHFQTEEFWVPNTSSCCASCSISFPIESQAKEDEKAKITRPMPASFLLSTDLNNRKVQMSGPWHCNARLTWSTYWVWLSQPQRSQLSHVAVHVSKHPHDMTSLKLQPQIPQDFLPCKRLYASPIELDI